MVHPRVTSKYVYKDHNGHHQCVLQNYFTKFPIHKDRLLCCWYHMWWPLFLQIMEGVQKISHMVLKYIIPFKNACDEYCKKSKAQHLNASNALLKLKGSFWIWTPQATHISIFVEGQGKEGLVRHVCVVGSCAFLPKKSPNFLIQFFNG